MVWDARPTRGARCGRGLRPGHAISTTGQHCYGLVLPYWSRYLTCTDRDREEPLSRLRYGGNDRRFAKNEGRGSGASGVSLCPGVDLTEARVRIDATQFSKGVLDVPSPQRDCSRLHRRNNAGQDQLSRVDRRQVGDPVFPSQGLHPGLHDRTRLHGQDRARVHQAQRQAHRLERRPERGPCALARRHRGDARREGELPDHRRPRSQGLQALQHVARRGAGHVGGPDRGDKPDRAHGLSSSGPTRRSSSCSPIQ